MIPQTEEHRESLRKGGYDPDVVLANFRAWLVERGDDPDEVVAVICATEGCTARIESERWCEGCGVTNMAHAAAEDEGWRPDFDTVNPSKWLCPVHLATDTEVTVRADEAAFLVSLGRCECGHLVALHNDHCCDFCLMPGCECEKGALGR